MKKAIMSLCLAAALVFGAAGVQAADQDKGNNPVLQFTGSVWQKSSLDNKLSFLFGMDTAIARNTSSTAGKLNWPPRTARCLCPTCPSSKRAG